MGIRMEDFVAQPGYIDDPRKVEDCPRCGHDAVCRRMAGGFEYSVGCTSCNMWLGEWCEGYDEAIDKWNHFCVQEKGEGGLRTAREIVNVWARDYVWNGMIPPDVEKVYVVTVHNDEYPEYYEEEIQGVFASIESATAWLEDAGFDIGSRELVERGEGRAGERFGICIDRRLLFEVNEYGLVR